MKRILFILLILAWISPEIRAQYVNADLGRPDVPFSLATRDKLVQNNYVSTRMASLPIQKAMPVIPDKTAYVFLLDNNDIPEYMGMASFQIPKPDVYTLLSQSSWEHVVYSGVYAEDTYYAYVCRVNIVSGAAFPTELATFNFQTNTWRTVCQLNGKGGETISDLTYDYSTGTAYAIKNTGLFQTTLYEFSLTDGSLTEVCPLDATTYILAIACNYDGEMYGIGSGGGLYRIDKQTGSLSLVGNTGYMPWFLQSMEFDHTDGTLYWAGADAEHTFLATIDTATAAAVEIGTFVQGCNTTGIHIPFTRVKPGAPGAATNFSAQPGQKGELYAQLSWTNPVIDPFGSILTDRDIDVRIYRDGDLIHEITGTEPGAQLSYRDGEPAAGSHEYSIVAYNGVGAGETAKQEVWIGEDYPNEPQNITISALNGSVNLTWDVSETGAHGGWVNKARLYSTIVREQDGTTVLDRQIAYNGTDDNLTSTGKWSYRIIVSDENGNSAEAKTDLIVAGPALPLPYFEDFQDNDFSNLWTVRNENGDTLYWKHTNFHYDDGARYLQYRMSQVDQANDYVIAPPVTLQAGKDYLISFDARIQRMHLMSQEKIEVFVAPSPTKGAETTTVQELTLGDYDTNWATRRIEFSPTATGDYYTGLYLHSDPDQNWVCIDNFRIEEIYYYDLEVTAFTGPNSAIANMNSTYGITVHNKGSREVSDFTVRIVDKAGNTLGETHPEAPLAAGETATYQVTINLQQTGNYQVYAEVVIPTDGDQSNNKTGEPFDINVHTNGDFSIMIGETAGITARDDNGMPFMKSNPNNVWTQSIYLASEINATNGLITQMEWYGSGFDIYPVEFPVKIYLGNTSASNLSSGELPTSEMTLVYDGIMSFANAGQKAATIKFTQPFNYTGGNMVVCIYRENTASSPDWRGVTGGMEIFYAQSAALRYWDGFRGDTLDFKPVVSIFMDATGNSLSGTVTSTDGTPLAGVKVTVNENGMNTTTDEEGNYRFDLVNTGTYHVSYSVYGYYEHTDEITITGDDDTPVTNNVQLEEMKRCNLTLTVTNGLGNVAGAAVSLNGYSQLTGTTDNDGQLTFNDVICSEYTAVIESQDYTTLHDTLQLSGDNATETLTFTVKPKAYPVDGFTMAPGDAPVLSWNAPVRVNERRYDDGVATTRAGGAATAEGQKLDKAVFGIIEENAGSIKQVSWYLVETEGKTERTVNLFVFNLDSDGSPELTPVYGVNGITSTVNEWFTYTLDEPYSTDRPFFIALSCTDEYLGLGVDGSYFNPTDEYPFREMLQYYSTNYTQQFYPSAIWYKGNFMIRLQMADAIPEAPGSTDLLQGYNVYRFLAADRGNRGNWQTIADHTAATTFTDDNLAAMPQGYYQYAVTAAWGDMIESEPVVSEIVEKDMLTAVTLQFSTKVQSQSALDGTTVQLVSTDGEYRYTATVADGQRNCTIRDVSKGSYRLTVVSNRFETISEEISPDTEDAYTFSYTLDEKLTAPVNLTASPAAEDGTYDLTWNLTSNIFEDFESHPDFTLNSPGEIGWSYLDNDDNERTYGLSANGEQVIYDNWGTPTAYIIFNPSTTDPRSDSDGNINAYSGSKFLGSFASSSGANDDFIISPELFFDSDFEFSFYARSYSDVYGTDKMMVGYSLTDIEPESFTWLNNGLEITVPAYLWTHYTYTIPAAAKYVTIRCVSNDTFLFMVDDIQIGSGEAAPFRTFAQKFEIYLDGEKKGETTDNTYQIAADGGRHTIGVKAIYETGESEMSEITVGSTTSVELTGGNSGQVFYSNRRLWFQGLAEEAQIYSSTGVRVMAVANAEGGIDLNELERGVYIASVIIDGKRNIVKFIIR